MKLARYRAALYTSIHYYRDSWFCGSFT